MERYRVGGKLGEGTFGVVVRATELATGRAVAIKQIKHSESCRYGVNWTALREIKFLQELRHNNVVELLDVFVHDEQLNLVFEFMLTDLEKLIRSNELTSPEDIKAYMWMLLNGLKCCHNNFLLHRDLKPNNLLISPGGVLKLGDFGLARAYGSPLPTMTIDVVTLWYRAPELMFGATKYGEAVDMWAVGCIFAELLNRKALFCGQSEIKQLNEIFKTLGTPNETNWPGVSKLPNYLDFTGTALGKHLQHVCPSAPATAIDLLSQLLKLDPNKRLKASEVRVQEFLNALVPSTGEALDHPYFRSEPHASTPLMLVAAVKRASTITPRAAIESAITRPMMIKTGAAKRIRLDSSSSYSSGMPLRAPSFDE